MRVTYLMRCLMMMRGGGETQHLAWMRGLMQLGVEVNVITGRPLVGHPRYPIDGFPTSVIRSPYLRDLVYSVQGTRGFGRLGSQALHADEEWFCRAAWRRIARLPHPPDLVLAHALHQAARLRRGDVPVAVYLPGPPHARYLADLRLADALISDGWAAAHLPEVIERPVDDVVKGVDTTLFTPEGPNHRDNLELTDARVVLAVSRLVPIKNLSLLLQAVADARATCRQVVLLVVGEGPEQGALESKARDLVLGRAVRFIGYVAQDDLPAWYRTADVFALSSDFDNSPNAVLEAMAAGLPIVSTDVGGLRGYISPERNGLLVPKGSRQALASALLTYVNDPRLRRAVGQRNREDALTKFSWLVSARRMRAVYERVIEARKARRQVAMAT